MKNKEFEAIKEQMGPVKKVCIITDQFPPYPQDITVLRGGVDIGLHQLSQSFSSKGYDVIIITQNYFKKIGGDNPGTHRVRTYIPYTLERNIVRNGLNFMINETFNVITYWKIRKILKKEKPDAVLIGGTHQFSLAPLLATLSLHIPMYIRYDWLCPTYPKETACDMSTRVLECGKCIERYNRIHLGKAGRLLIGVLTTLIFQAKLSLWKKSNGIFPVNDFYAELYGAMGVPKELNTVIPTHRDIKKVPVTTEKFIRIRKEYDFVFLYVGRLNPEKGILLLIDSFNNASFGNKNVGLVIAGDGILREEVDKRAKVNNQITALGWMELDSISELYQISNAIVVPSVVPEGNPRSAEEAMVFEKTIIGFDLGGMHEIFERYPYGMKVEKMNKESLAEALMYATQHPKSNREKAE